MNTLILATALNFLSPAEAASPLVDCQSMERFAAVVMHARQTGSTKSAVSSFVPGMPDQYQDKVVGLIDTAFKKPRFIYSEEERLNSINQFRTEVALECYSE